MNTANATAEDRLQESLRSIMAFSRSREFRNYLIFAHYLHFCVVAVFLLAILLVDLFQLAEITAPRWHMVLLMFVAASMVSFIVTFIRMRLEPLDYLRLSRYLDDKGRLKNRLSTAAELTGSGHPMEQLVLHDAWEKSSRLFQQHKDQLFPRAPVLNNWLSLISICLCVWSVHLPLKRSIQPLFDRTSPTIVEIFPARNATQVPLNSSVYIRFSESLDPATVNSHSVYLRQADREDNVPGVLTLMDNNKFLVFTPARPLQLATLYGLFLSGYITDPAGNALEVIPGKFCESYVMTFTTQDPKRHAPLPELKPFQIALVDPFNGERDVALNKTMRIEFTAPVAAETVDSRTVYLRKMDAERDVDCEVILSEKRYSILLQPIAHLEPDTLYGIFIEPNIRSEQGMVFWPHEIGRSSLFVSTFTTGGQTNGSGNHGGQAGLPGINNPAPNAGIGANPDGGGQAPALGGSQGSTAQDPFAPQKQDSASNPQQKKPREQNPRENTDNASAVPPDAKNPVKKSNPGNAVDNNIYKEPERHDSKIVQKHSNPLVDEKEKFHKYLENYNYVEKPGVGEQPETPKPYEELYQDYQKKMQESLQRSSIPPVFRSVVKDYFTRIAPPGAHNEK